MGTGQGQHKGSKKVAFAQRNKCVESQKEKQSVPNKKKKKLIYTKVKIQYPECSNIPKILGKMANQYYTAKNS